MGKQYAADRVGFALTALSTAAGLTGDWYTLPYPYKTHALEIILAGSTAAITGAVALEGKLSTGGTAVTLVSWSSTLTSGTPKDSTNSQIVNYVRIKSTGLASTASTGTVAATATGFYAAIA
jgi:hypothetical protein